MRRAEQCFIRAKLLETVLCGESKVQHIEARDLSYVPCTLTQGSRHPIHDAVEIILPHLLRYSEAQTVGDMCVPLLSTLRCILVDDASSLVLDRHGAEVGDLELFFVGSRAGYDFEQLTVLWLALLESLEEDHPKPG